MKGWELAHWRVEFEPRDCWIGVYWNKKDWEPVQGYPAPSDLHIYICLIPMVPLHLVFTKTPVPIARW